jgi:hypothetical protein
MKLYFLTLSSLWLALSITASAQTQTPAPESPEALKQRLEQMQRV